MTLTTRTKASLIAISLTAIGAIASYEGFVDHTYTDAVGVKTIGYGHTGSDVKAGMKITRQEAQKLLVKDTNKHWEEARKYITVPLHQYEADAYASFVFNVGVGNFRRSSLLKKLNQGRYSEACAELRKWVYSGGRKLPGLVKRRQAEYLMCIGRS